MENNIIEYQHNIKTSDTIERIRSRNGGGKMDEITVGPRHYPPTLCNQRWVSMSVRTASRQCHRGQLMPSLSIVKRFLQKLVLIGEACVARMHFNTFRLCIGITSLCILLIIEGKQVSATWINTDILVPTTNQNQSKQNNQKASAGKTDVLTQRSTLQQNAQTSTQINASKTGTANFIKGHHLQKEITNNEKKSTDISGVFPTNTIDIENNSSVKVKATTDKKPSISTSSTPFGKATYKTTKVVSSLPSKDTESKKFTSGSPVIMPSLGTSNHRNTKPVISNKTTKSIKGSTSVTLETSESTLDMFTEQRPIQSTPFHALTTATTNSLTEINSANLKTTTSYPSLANTASFSNSPKETTKFGPQTVSTNGPPSESTASTEPPVNTKLQTSFSTDMFPKSENNQQISSTASVASVLSTGKKFSTVPSNSTKTTIEQTTYSQQEHATSYKDLVPSSTGVPNTEPVEKSTQNMSETEHLWITKPSIQFNSSVEKPSTNSNASNQPGITPTTTKTIPSTEIKNKSSLGTTPFFSASYTDVTLKPETESHTATQPNATEETTGVVTSERTTIDASSLGSTATNPSATFSLTKSTTLNIHTTGNILSSTELNHTQTSNVSTKTTTTGSETTTEGMTSYGSPTTAVETIVQTDNTKSEQSTQQASPKETTDYPPSSNSQKTGIYETKKPTISPEALSTKTNDSEYSTMRIQVTVSENQKSKSQTRASETISYQPHLSQTSHVSPTEATKEYQPSFISTIADKETTEKHQNPTSLHANDRVTTELQHSTSPDVNNRETTEYQSFQTETPQYQPSSSSPVPESETTENQHSTSPRDFDKETTEFQPSSTLSATGKETEFQLPFTSQKSDRETTETSFTSHPTFSETTEFQTSVSSHTSETEKAELKPSTSLLITKEIITIQPSSRPHPSDNETTEFQPSVSSHATDKEKTEYQQSFTSDLTDRKTTKVLPLSSSSSSLHTSDTETTEILPSSKPETTIDVSSMTVTTTDQPPSTSLSTDGETEEYQPPSTLNETTDFSTTGVLTTHAESTNTPHPLTTDNESTEYHSSDVATTEIPTINETTAKTTKNAVTGTTTPMLGIETSAYTNEGQTFLTSDTTSERLPTSSVGMSTESELQYTTEEHSTNSEIFSTQYELEMTTGVTDTTESKFTESTTTERSVTTGAYQETEPSTTMEITTEEVSTTTNDAPSNTGSTDFTLQYLSTSEGSLLETTKSSTNHPGEETTWSSTVGFSAETTSLLSGMTSPTTINSAETSPSDKRDTDVPVKISMSTTVMESSSISDKTSLIENVSTETSEQVPTVEFTTLGLGNSFTTEEGATTTIMTHKISTAQEIPSSTEQVSAAFSTPQMMENTSSTETALPMTASLTQSTRETLGFSESTVENEETTLSNSATTPNATLGLQTTDISTIPSKTQETGSNIHTDIPPVHSTIDNIKFSAIASTDKPESTEETDAQFVTSSNGVSELPQTSSAELEYNFTTNGAEVSTTTNNGISQSKGISGHQTTFDHHSTGTSSSKANTGVPGNEPTTLESVTGSSTIPTRDVTFSTQSSAQIKPHIDSAYFEFGIVIWISGTFERKLKDDFKFKLEISLLVKDNFLPKEYRNIFQLEVATVTKGSIKVHVQAKVKVGSLRRINTTVESAVQKMVNTLESVNYTKLNTSRGKLYDNKGGVRRSFLLHQNDTECDAVDICGSFQKCILSNNNTTAVLCNPMQRACYLECGPNGECVQSVDTTYCSCASDWLNIYYGVNCESRAVSLEAQLGITFGSLGVVFMIIFVGCLIRSRRTDKESFLEDDATGWRGLNGGDSRWSTFSGRYSTRDVPYKRSLRDGRYLVPAHDPFGSGRLTRPGLYLPRNGGLMATSFIDAVPSYSHFNLEADFTIKRPVVSKEPSAIYLTDQSWGSVGYTNPAFYDFVEERTHL
uniref:SEA domain-containing protein n=2 Tax=Magallana gigas TaxID=29159 RepID=A0A8W8LGQ3_MAGGI